MDSNTRQNEIALKKILQLKAQPSIFWLELFRIWKKQESNEQSEELK